MSSPTAATEGAYREDVYCAPYHEFREQEDAQVPQIQSGSSPLNNHCSLEFPQVPRRGGLSAQTQTPISPATRQPMQSQPMQSQSQSQPQPQSMSSSASHHQQDQQQQQHQTQSQQTLSFPKRREEEVAAAAAVAARRNSNLAGFTANAGASLSGAPNCNGNDDSDSSTLAQQSHPPLQIRFHPHSRQNSVAAPHSRQGSVTGLQIRTDIIPQTASTRPPVATRGQPQGQTQHHDQHSPDSTNYQTPTQSHQSEYFHSASTVASHNLTPSTNLRKTLSAVSLNSGLSPGVGLPSPALAAMIDITPLPSPITSGELSPAPWKRLRTMEDRCHSRERPPSSSSGESGPSSLRMLSPPRYSMPLSPDTPPKKKKGYGSLMSTAVEAQAAASANINMAAHGQNATLQQQRETSHSRNRSVSDFVPEQLHNVRPRTVTVNLSNVSTSGPSDNSHPMHREQYLAAERGLVTPHVQPSLQLPDPTKALPSPPPSNRSMTGSEMDEEDMRTRSRPTSAHQSQMQPSHLQTQQSVDKDHEDHEDHEEDADAEFFLVRDTHNPSKKRKWRALRPLGQGTFSKVVLATSQALPRGTPYIEANLNPRNLVAVKIVEHGPAGGADEERIEVSLKREVDILKTVSHPCIVQLKAMEITDERALLVLTYCPGGDLFELASERRDILTKDLVQRIFGEVVSAVRWLHEGGIVHRDLKLENVLVHPKSAYLTSLTNPQSHPTPLTLLTDLGLSRRIPLPPASPLLTTRCGSEDYAAPEILLGQPYDGRSTDAWALGVLLYALMEGRLPFDCPPGKIERSRVSHRVARCDWIWTRFGDDDGEWDEGSNEAAEWRPAGEVVEGLLKKVRMGRKPLSEVEEMEWVKGGTTVPGGLKRVDEQADGPSL